jgi:hypothetical protein
MPEYEKSAVKIQSQFRGVKARKQIEDEKKAREDDIPTSDVAKPADKEPEILNPLVKKTLESLGPYEYGPQ